MFLLACKCLYAFINWHFNAYGFLCDCLIMPHTQEALELSKFLRSRTVSHPETEHNVKSQNNLESAFYTWVIIPSAKEGKNSILPRPDQPEPSYRTFHSVKRSMDAIVIARPLTLQNMLVSVPQLLSGISSNLVTIAEKQVGSLLFNQPISNGEMFGPVKPRRDH